MLDRLRIINSCKTPDRKDRPTLQEVKKAFDAETPDLLFACQVDLLKIEMDAILVVLAEYYDRYKDTEDAKGYENCQAEISTVKQDIDNWASLAEHLHEYTTARSNPSVESIQEFIKNLETSDPITIIKPPVLEKIVPLLVPPAAVVPTVADITQRNIQPNLPRPISQSTHYDHAETATLIAKAVVLVMGVLATALAFAAFGPLAAVIAIGFTALTYAAVAEKPEKPMRAPGTSGLFGTPKPTQVTPQPTSSPTRTAL